MAGPLHVIILAAGEGKRMRSARPKVLQPIAGQPMLAQVISAARALDPAGIHIVHGHGGTLVQDAFASQPDLHWAHQAQQLGTGHAVEQAMADVPDAATVLVLYGDVPLIRSDTLTRLLQAPGRLAVLVAEMPTPPAMAASSAMPKAGSRPSSSRRTPTRNNAASMSSTPASSPPSPPR